MKDATIVIAGVVGVGKTTLAEIIKEALEAKGIKTLVFGETFDRTTLEARTKAVAEKTEVSIKTFKTTRKQLL